MKNEGLQQGKENRIGNKTMEEKKLRTGYTTGTCAAAAAKAAAVFLLTGRIAEEVEVELPGGTFCRQRLEVLGGGVLQAEGVELSGIPGAGVSGNLAPGWDGKRQVSGWFGVKKDAGDDPDVTHGAVIYAQVERLEQRKCPERCYELEEFPGIYVTGGPGVGLATRPGLSCPPGYYAINPGPRRMILSETAHVCAEAGETGPILIRIAVPEGIGLSEKTFNPRLGIEGGISILGTTGIVKPMSEEALKETIRLDIHMQAAAGNQVILMAPGNYGEKFFETEMGISPGKAVLCSNYVKAAVQMLQEEGVKKVLFASHAGKLVKVSAGMENTHSRFGDGRMEQMERLTRRVCGEEIPDREGLCSRVRECNTTDEALKYLLEKGLASQVLEEMAQEARRVMEGWSRELGGDLEVAVAAFSSACRLTKSTENAADCLNQWRQQEGTQK